MYELSRGNYTKTACSNTHVYTCHKLSVPVGILKLNAMCMKIMQSNYSTPNKLWSADSLTSFAGAKITPSVSVQHPRKSARRHVLIVF